MAIITFKDLQGVEHSVDLDGNFNVAFNCDCETIMQVMPDKCVTLLCADPPYGDGNPDNEMEHRNQRGRFDKYNDSSQTVNVERERERDATQVEPIRTTIRPLQGSGSSDSTAVGRRTRGRSTYRIDHLHSSMRSAERERESSPDWRDLGGEVRKKIIAWDVAPGKEVFDELFRVSRNSVIWGGNYFDLPPTRCFLVWRKLSISENFSMAMAEYAWTSFNANAKVFECAPQGKPGDPRFHPTAKPIDLYRWVFNLFCKPGDTVFDPYLGSGSSRIAAYDAGLNFIGCEIDPVYFAKEEERFTKHTEQISLWE